MQYTEIIKIIYNLTGIKAKQREIAEILGLRVNAIGLRASRGSGFSIEEIQKIGGYYGIDILQQFKASAASDNPAAAAKVPQKDELIKNIITLLNNAETEEINFFYKILISYNEAFNK